VHAEALLQLVHAEALLQLVHADALLQLLHTLIPLRLHARIRALLSTTSACEYADVVVCGHAAAATVRAHAPTTALNYITAHATTATVLSYATAATEYAIAATVLRSHAPTTTPNYITLRRLAPAPRCRYTHILSAPPLTAAGTHIFSQHSPSIAVIYNEPNEECT
jgi:hypothetical protein